MDDHNTPYKLLESMIPRLTQSGEFSVKLKHLTGQHNQKKHGNRGGVKVSNEAIKKLDKVTQKYYDELSTRDQVKFRLAWYRKIAKDPSADPVMFAIDFEADRLHALGPTKPAATPATPIPTTPVSAPVANAPAPVSNMLNTLQSVADVDAWKASLPGLEQSMFTTDWSQHRLMKTTSNQDYVDFANAYKARLVVENAKVPAVFTDSAAVQKYVDNMLFSDAINFQTDLSKYLVGIPAGKRSIKAMIDFANYHYAQKAPATTPAPAPAPAPASSPSMTLAQAKNWYANLPTQLDKNRFRTAWFHEQKKNPNADYADFASKYQAKKAGTAPPAAPVAAPKAPKAPRAPKAPSAKIADMDDAGVYMAMLSPITLNKFMASVGGHAAKTGMSFSDALLDYANIHLQANPTSGTIGKKISTAVDAVSFGRWYNKLDASQKVDFDTAWAQQSGARDRGQFAKTWAKLNNYLAAKASATAATSAAMSVYVKGKITQNNFQGWVNNLASQSGNAFQAFSTAWTNHKSVSPNANIIDFANDYAKQQKAAVASAGKAQAALAKAQAKTAALQSKTVYTFTEAKKFVDSLDAAQKQDFFDNYWGVGAARHPASSASKMTKQMYVRDAQTYQRDLLAGNKGTTQVSVPQPKSANAPTTGWVGGQYKGQVTTNKSDWTQWDDDTTYAIVNGRPKGTTYSSSYSGYQGDGSLYAILKDKGMLGKPELVDSATMNKLRSEGNQIIFRGISSSTNNAGHPDLVKQFMEGDFQHVGVGVFGNGQYTSDSPKILSQYGNYGMCMAISKTAKIINFDDLLDAKAKLEMQFRSSSDGTKYQRDAMQTILSDNGRVAAYLGYDGYHVPDPTGYKYSSYGASGASNKGFWVMLNHTALAVENNYFTKGSWNDPTDLSSWSAMAFKEFMRAWEDRYKQLTGKLPGNNAISEAKKAWRKKFTENGW